MRILTISDVYFPRINGVSTSIATFRAEYRRLGHEMLLVAPCYGCSSEEQDIVRVPSHRLFFDPEDRLMHARRVRRLEKRLAERSFDVLHIQTPFLAHRAGLHLAVRLGLPTIETYHTYFEEYLFHYLPIFPKAWMRALARRFSRAQCNRVDAVVVPSRAMARVLADYGVRSRVEIIPTGLRLEELAGGNGEAFRQRHGISASRPTLVHVGRVAFEKNIDFLLRMLVHVKAKMPEILLVIAGEGPAERSLHSLTAELGLGENVLFVGYLSREKELLDCYCAGDAFVFASRTETQGLVLLEAMALGVPVVSTAVMGTADVLEGCPAALIAEEDENDFSAKVLELLAHPERKRELGRAGRPFAERWSAAASAARMVELYREVSATRSATSVWSCSRAALTATG